MSGLVSIIVPVHNAEKTLCRCVDSVFSQSYQEWELFLVDDGSDDGSASLCDLYSNRDSRIKTVHKFNGGVSSARNVGIKLSNGEYVAFLDADDELTGSALLSIVASIEGEIDLLASEPFHIPEVTFESPIEPRIFSINM